MRQESLPSSRLQEVSQSIERTNVFLLYRVDYGRLARGMEKNAWQDHQCRKAFLLLTRFRVQLYDYPTQACMFHFTLQLLQ